MLLTDMDKKEDEEDKDRVTLMTVHSAKGLEYEYIYVVGCEENLFPSQRALETVEGIEEERRLFYVALTRAKSLATLSCVDMRFKWGSMEFSKPSRFLAEIDEQYVECDFNLRKPRGEQSEVKVASGGKDESAIDVLRRRFDVRYQQKPKEERRDAGRELGGFQRAQTPPQRDVTGMRRMNTSTVGQVTSEECAYAVGERVEHPKFGRGEIVQVVPLATDHKLVVRFASGEEKTLLSKLAKLTKL
jgi:DNA helicase-2/ATP-dependent DNA helicase PcrA